jgi:DNA-binding response OmpR family regulator
LADRAQLGRLPLQSFQSAQLSLWKDFFLQCRVPLTPRKPAVLIVEDDPELRTLYRTALSLAGYSVIGVSDGVDALRHIDADPPDLMVLDMGLPRLGGGDVRREIESHAETATIPIVVVTGDARGLNTSHFACVLQKPIDLDTLVRTVERCLRNARV